jgi:hypothetical protein
MPRKVAMNASKRARTIKSDFAIQGVSEAVKKCTTMAGSVAPREWLRHGGPQKQ